MPRPVLYVAIAVLAFLLAFPLRGAVQTLIITPLAYLFWAFGLIYHFLPQQVLWIFLILLLFYVAIYSFASKPIFPDPVDRKRGPGPGPVEKMASWIERSPEGVYFKWEVARILAYTALNIIQLRQKTDEKKLDWGDQPPAPAVDRYLDAGLNSSFSDYPLPRSPLKRPDPTPFDTDLSAVVDFLESQMEQKQ